jgi:hypothetical protein
MGFVAVRASATIAYEGARFTYTEGALHSADDEPAFTVRAHSKPLQCVIAEVFYYSQSKPATYMVKWQKIPLGDTYSYIDIAEESRWYAKGELHRDFGPAVAGHAIGGVSHYWHKYDRGVLGAGSRNTFGNDNAVFECAPGAVICSFTQYNEKTICHPNVPDCWITVRMYRSALMQVVAASSGAWTGALLVAEQAKPGLRSRDLSQLLCVRFSCVRFDLAVFRKPSAAAPAAFLSRAHAGRFGSRGLAVFGPRGLACMYYLYLNRAAGCIRCA